jgi:YesN/AraC family two-component response regulator
MEGHTFDYYLNNFTFDHSYRNNPTDITTHIHDGYELFYYISGDLTYYIEGQAYQLEPQDMIITNRRELHRIVFHSKERYERKFIHFKPEFVSFVQSEEVNLLHYLEKRKLGHYNRIGSKEVISSGIAELWDRIGQAAKENVPESPLMIKLLLTQMLIEINRIYSKNKEIIMLTFDNNDKIIAILEYINTHLDQKITLDLLEQLFYVNKYYLCHIFKLNTGFTVNEYITYKRIMKAQELLNKNIPVLEVSGTVGFGDYSNFYKAFKKIVGCPPKNYIK